MDFLKAYLSSKTKWSGFASLWPSFHSAKLELICIHEVWGYSKSVYWVVCISRDSLKTNKFRDLEKVYVGLMAQEVLWATEMHSSGYLMVDYSKLDVDFKRFN